MFIVSTKCYRHRVSKFKSHIKEKSSTIAGRVDRAVKYFRFFDEQEPLSSFVRVVLIYIVHYCFDFENKIIGLACNRPQIHTENFQMEYFPVQRFNDYKSQRV